MGTVRTGTLAARPTEIANVTVTNPGLASTTLLKLLSDRKTLIFSYFNGIATSTDYGVTITARQNFLDSTWSVGAVAETPGGELLVALTKSGQAGVLFRSTGWNGTTATSWAQVLTSSGAGCVFRNEWSLSSKGHAPSWSKHAGAMFVSEYGPQADTAATLQQGAIRVWMSSDDGATWREIFNLVNQWAAQSYTRLHVHAVAYDPWAGRVIVTQGDGGNADPGQCGVWWSANPEAATPIWNLIPGTNTTTSFEQVTTVLPTEAGLILLPDGRPQGARLVPRRGAARYGTMRELVNMSGYNDGLVGSGLHRNGGYESPLPGHPILFTVLESTTSTGYGYPALWVSNDGMQYRQLYRHGTAVSGTAPGLQRIFGPTVDGKLVGWMNLAGTGQVFLADYLPVAEKAATTATTASAPVTWQQFQPLLSSPLNPSGTWQLTANGTSAYLGTFNSTAAAAQNDAATWPTQLAAGTYTLDVLTRQSPSQAVATVDLSTDGGNTWTAIGTTDLYAASAAGYRATFTGVVIPTDGRVWLRFRALSKNASSTGYGMGLSAALWTRTA